MNLKILLLSAALAPGLALSAFTVDDLVVDNGIYAIESLYWGKMDQGLNINDGVCDYANPPYGGGNTCHFEYVRNVNEEILPTFVKLVGFRGFTGAKTYTDRDFVFTIADENNNPVEDGTRLILPNEDFWARDESRMQLSIINYESCVSRDGQYMLGALGRQDTKWWYDEWKMSVPPYLYWMRSGSRYQAAKSAWIGEMSRNAEGNVVVTFSEPAILSRTAYSGNGGTGAANRIPVSLSTNSIQLGIIDCMTIETFRPTGFFKVTEFPFTTEGYGSGTSYTVPYKMTTNLDGTCTIVNLVGKGYTRSMDETSRIAPGVITGRIENGTLILDGGQPFDVWHGNATGDWGKRLYDAAEQLAGLPKFPARNYSYDDIMGSISTGNTISHTSESNFWVDPGECRTLVKGASIKIGPFAGVHQEGAYSTSAFSIESEGGTAETDVTLDCKITSCNCSFDEVEMIKYVDCTFEVNKNDMYVESYDIYMIPAGKVSGNPTNNGDFLEGNGHKHAIYVGSVTADSNSQTIYPKAYNVSTSVLLDNAIADASNEYYFFIAANYRSDIAVASLKSVSRAASSLHPTFHSLFAPGSVTAIDGISAPEAGDVEYYDLHGRRVATPGQGIYLRRQGTSVSKIRF